MDVLKPEIKVLAEWIGDRFVVHPLGLPFTVESDKFREIAGNHGDGTYLLSVTQYNALAALANK